MIKRHPVLPPGLSTKEALSKLHIALKIEVDTFQNKKESFSSLLFQSLHHRHVYSTFRWTSALYIVLVIISFFISLVCDVSYRSIFLLIECFILVFFLIANSILVTWEEKLRRKEMMNKAKIMIKAIKNWPDETIWTADKYPNLYTPQSPCITLQWTHRDGQLVNLPHHLLVTNDVITLRPGHPAPASCKSIEEGLNGLELSAGEIFVPRSNKSCDNFSSARYRAANRSARFVLLETPYLASLRLALKKALDRPASLFIQEQHKVIFYFIESLAIPLILLICLVMSFLNALYIHPNAEMWIETIILRSALALLPLTNLVFPTIWVLLNAVGIVYLHNDNQQAKQMPPVFMKDETVNILEELEVLTPSSTDNHSINWNQLKVNLKQLLVGESGDIWRSSNLLHTLGTITTLCCIDKKGILSWPNPTPEKVFFLKPPSATFGEKTPQMSTPTQETHLHHHTSSQGKKSREISRISKDFNFMDLNSKHMLFSSGSQVEVLDMTHNLGNAFGVQFDDSNWNEFIGNLKPLGLGILLNTCNPSAQDYYSKFCDHIACESLFNDAAVPVVNKRCLCELAMQIGFSNQAVSGYTFQQQVALFRHVRAEAIQKGKLAKSLNIPRLKMPFPNMTCAIIKDSTNSTYQIFSQGTADLVLDACSEYWNGKDLKSLTDTDRKRILDFYHRSSLTAHCMAFSYGPISRPLDRHTPEGYFELPPDSSHIFPSLRSLNSVRSWDWHPHEHRPRHEVLNRHLSSDSLIYREADSSHVDKNMRLLGNEIFIGMVTMQYQACSDFVQLVEQLDKGCIRFVHFSKENELRSRVFSEKMGLESGWNAHISLLSEKSKGDSDTSLNKTEESNTGSNHMRTSSSEILAKIGEDNKSLKSRSVSAPMIINLDISTVKFEEEISVHPRSTEDNSISEEDLSLANYSPSGIPTYHGDNASISKSPSRVTESTDQSSAPLTFDMSNRAKLPKGIENIRPHLAQVDNVPLLVSLFTDSTPQTTAEMIGIMQEYEEVICCVGSSANSFNMAVFLQADASIAINPLYPQLCKQTATFNSETRGPTELNRQLNSLPCNLAFHRDEPVSLFRLIMLARHYQALMKNTFQFLLCCSLSLSVLLTLANLLVMPIPLSSSHVMWLSCILVPLLSISLMFTPLDKKIMSIPTIKKLRSFDFRSYLCYFGIYSFKFFPSIVVALSCFLIAAGHFCHIEKEDIPPACWLFYKHTENVDEPLPDVYQTGHVVSQNILAFLITLYFVFISIGFVHRNSLFWRKNIFANKRWFLACLAILILQAIFSSIDIALHTRTSPVKFLSSLPLYLWVIGFTWPLLLIPINVLMKRHEMKLNIRLQKRARLEFGTKLGMNSPF